jgi:4,5-DOPA dioxygenase extradiol
MCEIQSMEFHFAASASDTRMPVLFVGHGNPMNAIEDNAFSRAWFDMGKTLPTPKAILCISAHWQTVDTRVTAMDRPKTIHDFFGFPKPLSQMQYRAPGCPELADFVAKTLAPVRVVPDHEWGLDHGAWSVLCRMFPRADIPVVQLSLNGMKAPAEHYELGRGLKPLRKQGVLILASGNIVHNLSEVIWQDTAYDWAVSFDQATAQAILARDHQRIIHYQDLDPSAKDAVPTDEHFLPLLYALALQEPAEDLVFFSEKVTLGAISMRSLKIG